MIRFRLTACVLTIVLTSVIALLVCQVAPGADTAPSARVGVAKIDITPETPVRMYGYASRKTESEGIAGQLKASALAIGGDEGDGPAVLLCVDNGSVPAEMRAEVLRRVQDKMPLKPERFMLCNAHIHSGPDIKGMGSITGEEHKHLAQYAKQLTDRLEKVVLEALTARKPGRLDWAQGTVGFAANRRVLKDGKWSGFGAVPDAPADHTLPLLRVTDADGKLLAVVVNYACHNTTLRGDFKQIHADWAGCAQEFIEADNPGAVALVTLGCGADSDPCPHGTVELCKQHGRALADEVKRRLAGPMKPVGGKITARMMTLEFPYAPTPPIEELKELAKDSYPAQRLLKLVEEAKKPPERERYPIATWTFGNDLSMVFLADEVVVDYALRLRRELGSRLWINAYSNDVSAYIASNRLLKEGGYEVNNSLGAQVTYGRSEQMQPTMEDRIVECVQKLLPPTDQAKTEQAKLAQPPSNQPALPIKVSDNKRYFVDQNGKPVFWLGTTQWQLFRGYKVEDAKTIIEKTRSHGFAFAQVMLMGVGDGTTPNVYGEKPWINDDPLTPNEAYFKNVDRVMEIARQNNLVISMTLYHQRYRKCITLEKARAWAKWLATRYKDMPNIVWSMTPEATQEFVPILRELAAGLHEGDGGRHLITFKPDPAPFSSSFIHGESWLDFDSMQTWASVKLIYPMVTHDYNLRHTKPVLMAEGAYEAGTEYGFPVTPLWVRRQAYYSYLAGASHTYGHNDSWRILPTWKEALDAPGAVQMGVLKKIFFARKEWWLLAPDQSVFASGGRTVGEVLHLAARHQDGKWAMCYLADKATFSVDLSKLKGAKVHVFWIDPKTGNSSPPSDEATTGEKRFSTPEGWEDAILMLEAVES